MILSAQQASQLTVSNASHDYILLILQQIVDALETHATSCTLTVGSKAGADVKYVLGLLRQLGYIVTQSASTLTVSWA